jgi:hypothetical protein
MSSTGLECEHCYTQILPELYYTNVDGVIVCPDCARTSYSFIGEDEYRTNHNRGRFHVECSLCGDTEMEPIVSISRPGEEGMICWTCFDQVYNTKALTKHTKVTHTLVH